MGKYAPVIKTAECGSMTRAAHVLGYTPEIDSYYMLDKLHVVHGPRAFFLFGFRSFRRKCWGGLAGCAAGWYD